MDRRLSAATLDLYGLIGDQLVMGSTSDTMTEAEYFTKHGTELGFPSPPQAARKHYEFNLNAAQSRLQTGKFMTDLIGCLNRMVEVYAGGRPHLLYYPVKPSDLTILVKPWVSVLTKIYRVNYVHNRNYPGKPKGLETITLPNLYGHPKINDLLRARLICKYMDGLEAVASGLAKFCKEQSLNFRQYPMNSDVGYYARHCYISLPVELMFGDQVEEKSLWFELQLTTQLAEVIGTLTHGLYEGSRADASVARDDEWRWQPESQRFRSAYLGHTLHLLEGLIQTFRDEVLGLKSQTDPNVGIQRPDGLTSSNPSPHQETNSDD